MTPNKTLSINCYCCDGETTIRERVREVSYGRTKVSVVDEFTLCTDCGEEFYTGEQSSQFDRRAQAAAKAQGLVLPFEIRRLRKQLMLTQAEFETLLQIGPKTVAKWERGTVVPNPGMCQMLRMFMANPEIIASYLRFSKAAAPVICPPEQAVAMDFISEASSRDSTTHSTPWLSEPSFQESWKEGWSPDKDDPCDFYSGSELAA